MMGYAKVGEGADLSCGIGPYIYGLGTRNNNGQKLAELCQANNLILTNTVYVTIDATDTHGFRRTTTRVIR